jgi:hypothetical protein
VIAVKPPRSRWSLVLYILAAAMLIFQSVSFIYRMTQEPVIENYGFGWIVSEIFGFVLPAVLVVAVGTCIQYLTDIRWALLQGLERNDA